MSRPSGPRHGAEIVAASSVVIVGLIAVVLATSGIDDESLLSVIRLTARTSVSLFLVAFSASSMHALFPAALTSWVLAHRRYFGISFAISHLIHAAAIFSRAIYTGGASLEGRGGDLIGGGVVYGFIVFMLATSFDRTAAMVGPRVWKLVHTTGAYLVWTVFTLGFSLRAASSPAYLFPATLLVLALALRIIRRVRSRVGQGGR